MFCVNFFTNFSFVNWGLQSPITCLRVCLGWFHDYVNCWLLGVVVFLSLTIFSLLSLKFFFKTTGLMYKKSEVTCLLVPILVLFSQLIFSLFILYSSSSLDTLPSLTVKVVGNQ